MKNQITVICAITGYTYTGKQCSHISETPKTSKYWATAWGEFQPDRITRDEYVIHVNLQTGKYYIIKNQKSKFH